MNKVHNFYDSFLTSNLTGYKFSIIFTLLDQKRLLGDSVIVVSYLETPHAPARL